MFLQKFIDGLSALLSVFSRIFGYFRCMRWVESCGNPVYSEDFAYQGALPFINRIVCSDHFSFDSFVDPNDFFKGLKQDVVPIVNFTESKLTSLEDTRKYLPPSLFNPIIINHRTSL